jgi:serine/threonine-protein kinase
MAQGAEARRSSALMPGDTLGGAYRIVRFIGSGSMGQVYEAVHTRFGGRFAIKILHPHRTDTRAIARFRREAQIASTMQHANIVGIVSFDNTDTGVPYLVMEHVAGHELTQIIADDGPMPIDRVLNIVDQIASALSLLHRHGIVHRDLKPQNILVLPAQPQNPEQVKLVDFGISKVQLASLSLTGDRAILGTPHYMAPEQARSSGDVGPAADQFALAAVAYEMLTGRKAFDGDRVETVVYRIIHEDPPPLRAACGPLLAAALRRALAKNEMMRFPSIQEFASALRVALLRDAQPVAATLEQQLTPPSRPSKPSEPSSAGRWRRGWPAPNRALAAGLWSPADRSSRRPAMYR